MVAYLFIHRNCSHQQLCVINLSCIFYIFQHWNLLEKDFFCRHFHRSEGPLQTNFLQIKVEEDSKFLIAQITFKYSKKLRETGPVPGVFARWACVDHSPLLGLHRSIKCTYLAICFWTTIRKNFLIGQNLQAVVVVLRWNGTDAKLYHWVPFSQAICYSQFDS